MKRRPPVSASSLKRLTRGVRSPALVAALLVLSSGWMPLLSGCGIETAAIAAAGATAGFGLAQGQAEAFINGELKAARMVRLDDAWRATRAALHELHVPIKGERRAEFDGFVRGRAEGGPEIRIQVKAKAPLITKFEIRVGIIGDQAVSRLILARIDYHMGIPHPMVPVEQSPIMAPVAAATQPGNGPAPAPEP